MTRAQRRARNQSKKARYTKIASRTFGADLSDRKMGRLVNSGLRRKTEPWKTEGGRPQRRDVRVSDIAFRESLAAL